MNKALVAILLWILGACTDLGGIEVSTNDEADDTYGTWPSVSAPPFDVGEVIRRVHFSFRQEGLEFVGGDATYEVRAARSGRTSIQPFHWSSSGSIAIAGRPLVIETLSIRRGQVDLTSAARRAALDHGGGVRIERGASIEERLENGPEGLEQSWVFADRPHGTGDLIVRVICDGHDFVATTETGLHVVDPESGLGFRYGLATWIDGSGKRSTIQPRWRDGEIEIRIPQSTLLASTYPALLDPTIQPEFAIDTPVYGPAPEDQQTPAIAFDGTNWLVVWSDNRRLYYNGYDIFGARVDGIYGTILDQGGILIAGTAEEERAPAIVFDGTNYLVVFTSRQFTEGQEEIYGRKVSTAGVPQGTAPTGLNLESGDEISPAVAFGSSYYLVVWEDFTDTNVYSRRFNSDLSPAENKKTVTSATGTQSNPTVTFGGSYFYVAWQTSETGTWDVKGTRVNPATGSTMSPTISIGSGTGPQEAPTATYGGSHYFVAWQDQRGTSYDIYANRIDSNGSAQHGNGLLVSGATGAQKNPSTAYSSSLVRYFVVWEDFRNGATADVYGARVTTGGTVVDTSGLALSTNSAIQAVPVVAAGNSSPDFLVAWYDNRNSYGDVYGTRVGDFFGYGAWDPSGLLIAQAGNKEGLPGIAFDGTNYLVVWQDHRKANWLDSDIYGARVSGTVNADGTSDVLGTFAITSDTATQQDPDVAFDGTNYLVVWADKRSGTMDIWGARVGTNGTVIDTSGIDISSNVTGDQGLPAVSFGGAARYLVVWRDPRTTGNGGDIWAALVSISGGIHSRFAVLQHAAEQTEPDVASNGTDFLVVWEDWRNKGELDANYDIFGRRVTNSGGLLAETSISTASYEQQRPAVVYGGGTYYSVWEDCHTRTACGCVPCMGFPREGPGVWGATINPGDGSVGLNKEVKDTPKHWDVDVSWNGTYFHVVWWEQFNTPEPWSFITGLGGRHVQTNGDLPPAGTPERTPWNTSSSTGPRIKTPAVACKPANGNCLVPHVVFDNTAQTDRLKARVVLP